MSTIIIPVLHMGKTRFREVKWFAKDTGDFRVSALNMYTVFEKLGIDSNFSWRNLHSERNDQEKMTSCPDLLSCSCSFNIQLPRPSLTLEDWCLYLSLSDFPSRFIFPQNLNHGGPAYSSGWLPMYTIGRFLSALAQLSQESKRSGQKGILNIFQAPLFRFRDFPEFSGIRLPHQQEIHLSNNPTKS